VGKTGATPVVPRGAVERGREIGGRHVGDGDPPPTVDAIRAEFTDSIATALTPESRTTFGGRLERALLEEVRTRRAETAVLERALEREAHSLEAAADTVEGVVGWIVETDETPLTELGFEALRDRHETLADHRSACRTLLRERQSLIAATTNERGEVGLHHRTLLRSLYEDVPVEYPVLSTVLRLVETCASCQRAVRDHLVRRA